MACGGHLEQALGGHLEGTWRALGGHLHGRHFVASMSIWAVIGQGTTLPPKPEILY